MWIIFKYQFALYSKHYLSVIRNNHLMLYSEFITLFFLRSI